MNKRKKKRPGPAPTPMADRQIVPLRTLVTAVTAKAVKRARGKVPLSEWLRSLIEAAADGA